MELEQQLEAIDALEPGLDLDKTIAAVFFQGSVEPYSTEIASTWKLIDGLKLDNLRFGGTKEPAMRFSLKFNGGAWLAGFETDSGDCTCSIADSAPLAICQAALKAVSYDWTV